uniref:Uncharacterized protein n=1 Tax=Ditylenchus dipsaci TaxID=166011 RepID=A0A915EAK0_9BILA
MSAHQVVIGALNPSENCFSIGAVEGLNFIACAVVIPGSAYKREEIVNSVNCCADSGKVSVCYGKTIRILEPVLHSGKPGNIFSYRWIEAQSIELETAIDSVQWILDVSDCWCWLVTTCCCTRINCSPLLLSEEDATWEVVWSTKLPAKVKHVKFSPDGSLFATCGEDDPFVKIWYQQKESYSFSFIYIQHPAPVCGFEWRHSGRYMPRKFVQNTIITWCEDNTSRIWKEVPNRDSSQSESSLIEAAEVVSQEKHKRKKFSHKHFHLKKTKNRLVTKLSYLMNDKRSPTRSPTSGSSSNNLHCCFCLAASINAENDCFLVPQMNSLSHSKRPFTVHWLNNKELIFTNGAERILAEALLNEHADNVSAKLSHSGGDHSRGVNRSRTDKQGIHTWYCFPPQPESHVDIASAKDVLDIKLEVLLRQWSKSYDVLFSIHPVDGSLLTWTLEWLDDSWHQATVSFASRFPDAFPLTDASSLNLSMHTFNPHDPAYSEVLRKHMADLSSPENPISSDTISIRERFNDYSQLNNILLLTSHENGSLNLWRLSMDENRFSTIINIIHESRMCGHRFHISQVVAHPVLPLLLTASQFTPDEESVQSAKESELILWKVAPVGPLCKSGGLRELARVTSNSPRAFTCLSWVPAILPRCQRLLSHLHSKWNRSRESSVSSLEDAATNGDTSNKNYHQHLKEIFRVVSTQSTARPGCVLYVADVGNSEHSSSEIILLHIFEKDLVVSNSQEVVSESPQLEQKPQKTNAEVAFSGKYLVVMVVRTQGQDRVRMWSLTMNAERPLPLTTEDESNPSLTGKISDGIFYPQAESICPSAAKLSVHSEKVYDEALDFGQDIRITSCVASAGHLPSSSLQDLPAPYTLLLACSDDQIRFMRCVKRQVETDNCEAISHSYKWEKLKMINNEDSSLEMDGQIYSVSSAYSGRFAAAFRSAGAVYTDTIGKNLELAVLSVNLRVVWNG